MTDIIDGHNGKKKFFKGTGRKGKTKLDDYQKMLLESADTNFDEEPRQKSLTKGQLKKRGYVTPKSLNELVRWKD